MVTTHSEQAVDAELEVWGGQDCRAERAVGGADRDVLWHVMWTSRRGT